MAVAEGTHSQPLDGALPAPRPPLCHFCPGFSLMCRMMSQCLPACPSEGQSGCCSGRDLTPAPSPRPASPLPLCPVWTPGTKVGITQQLCSGGLRAGFAREDICPCAKRTYCYQEAFGVSSCHRQWSCKVFLQLCPGTFTPLVLGWGFHLAEPASVLAQQRHLLQLHSASSSMVGHRSVSFALLTVFVLAHG